MNRPFRVAVVQAAPVAFDTAATLALVAELLAEAATETPDLVLFPEAFVGGFPAATDWGGPATGVRNAEGGTEYLRYSRAAIAIPGPETATLGEMAARHGLALVIGVIERSGSSLACAVLHFDRTGALCHVRRKVMPTMAERTIWQQGDGASLACADLDGARVGTVICWENYMPLLRQSIYAEAPEIYCAPTADDLDSWTASMRHIALEARCFVLSACQFSQRSDFPADYGPFPQDAPEAVVSRGGSCIVSPEGALLAGPVFDRHAILTATIDLGDVIRARHAFDAVGHYARADVFSLHVDRRPRRSVTFHSD